jgi:hypothetical protein
VTAEDAANNESQPSNQACATPSAPARIVHVSDLDRSAIRKGKSSNWDASVTVTIRDAAGVVVSGATVSGSWSAGTGGGSGVTSSNGTVTLRATKLQGTSVTFTVSNVTTITIARP